MMYLAGPFIAPRGSSPTELLNLYRAGVEALSREAHECAELLGDVEEQVRIVKYPRGEMAQ